MRSSEGAIANLGGTGEAITETATIHHRLHDPAAAIAANIRGGECRVIARAAAGRIGRSGWGGKGMSQQGASRLVVLAVLFAGFISMIGTSAFPESTVTTSTPEHSPRPQKPL